MTQQMLFILLTLIGALSSSPNLHAMRYKNEEADKKSIYRLPTLTNIGRVRRTARWVQEQKKLKMNPSPIESPPPSPTTPSMQEISPELIPCNPQRMGRLLNHLLTNAGIEQVERENKNNETLSPFLPPATKQLPDNQNLMRRALLYGELPDELVNYFQQASSEDVDREWIITFLKSAIISHRELR